MTKLSKKLNRIFQFGFLMLLLCVFGAQPTQGNDKTCLYDGVGFQKSGCGTECKCPGDYPKCSEYGYCQKPSWDGKLQDGSSTKPIPKPSPTQGSGKTCDYGGAGFQTPGCGKECSCPSDMPKCSQYGYCQSPDWGGKSVEGSWNKSTSSQHPDAPNPPASTPASGKHCAGPKGYAKATCTDSGSCGGLKGCSYGCADVTGYTVVFEGSCDGGSADSSAPKKPDASSKPNDGSLVFCNDGNKYFSTNSCDVCTKKGCDCWAKSEGLTTKVDSNKLTCNKAAPAPAGGQACAPINDNSCPSDRKTCDDTNNKVRPVFNKDDLNFRCVKDCQCSGNRTCSTMGYCKN